MEGNRKVHTDLLQSCISQFEDIYNGNQTSIRFNNRKVEIVSIYSYGVVSFKHRQRFIYFF